MTRRLTLGCAAAVAAGIVQNWLRDWLRDDSEDMAKTMAALDRRLSRADELLGRLPRCGRRGHDHDAEDALATD